MARKTKFAKADFQVSGLPQTRREVFSDVLKMHWRSFVGFALLFLLFTVPFHVLAIREDIIQINLMGNFADMTSEQQKSAVIEVLSVKNMSAVLNILSFSLLSVFISGMLRVIRQYSWEENVFFGYDMVEGIKQNIGQVFPMFLLVGIINSFAVYAYNYSTVTSNASLVVLLAMAVFAVVIIGLPTLAYALVAVSLYNHTLIGNIKLGAVMAFKAPIRSFSILALFLLPFAPALVPNLMCHAIGRLIGSICMPVPFLAWYLFALDRFDEVVNKTKFPSLVGRGTNDHAAK